MVKSKRTDELYYTCGSYKRYALLYAADAVFLTPHWCVLFWMISTRFSRR